VRHRALRGAQAAFLSAAYLAVAALAGCGSDGGAPRLTVSAAASLKTPFTEYADDFTGAKVRLSFAGSDQLAAQVRAGARPDVLAAANAQLPAALHKEGLVDQPVRFAFNRLVVAVPPDGRVKRFEDLAKPGMRIAAGSPSVPVGAYTRRALAKLPPAQRAAIEQNLATEEPDVAAVVGRLRADVVDAGFVYVTDATDLRAIELPVQVVVAYAAAVVRGTKHPAEARNFIRGLVSGEGRRALTRAGFR
jgi:molybdate transport system substrate-binding protein